jgi:FkbM family methyltransferase
MRAAVPEFTMKNLMRRFLRSAGYELLHRSDDPVLAELRALHESLRLDPGNAVRWDDALPRPAADAHLRNLLQWHAIDLVVDAGANRGQFARLLRTLGYTGDIASFEPLQRHQRDLQRAAALDGRWKVFPVALGAHDGEADLHVYRDDSFSSLHAVNATGKTRFSGLLIEDQVERVAVRPLDAIWPQLASETPRRVLIKTDTQGHDLAVLQGAATVLPLTFAILAEAPFEPIYDGAASFAELSDWLRSRGFVPSGLFPLSHRTDSLALIEIDACYTRSMPPPAHAPS